MPDGWQASRWSRLVAPAAADGVSPGSNGRIFFDTGGPGRDIVSVDPQGGDRTKVTQGREPAVSPTGRREMRW